MENPVKINKKGIKGGTGEAKPIVTLSEIAEEDDLSSVSETNQILGTRMSLGKSIKSDHGGKISKVSEVEEVKNSERNIEDVQLSSLVRPLNHQTNS